MIKFIKCKNSNLLRRCLINNEGHIDKTDGHSDVGEVSYLENV